MTYDELCEEYAKTDEFMEPQITHRDSWWVIETDLSTTFERYESAKRSTEMPDNRYLIDFTTGYGARLSAPGYLDCTDWCVFDTEQEAIDYLAETYLEY